MLSLCCGLFFDQSKDEEVNQQAMANLAEALLSPTGGLAKLDLEMNSLSIAAAEKLLPAMVPVIQARVHCRGQTVSWVHCFGCCRGANLSRLLPTRSLSYFAGKHTREDTPG